MEKNMKSHMESGDLRFWGLVRGLRNSVMQWRVQETIGQYLVVAPGSPYLGRIALLVSCKAPPSKISLRLRTFEHVLQGTVESVASSRTNWQTHRT